MDIQFRPHHFLCAYCFEGKGYSPAFVANFTAIMAQLNSEQGEAARIHITSHTDSICAPCPHRTQHTCTSQEKIERLDAAHRTALGFQNTNNITWGEAKKRIQERIDRSTFQQICHECEWQALGICEAKLPR